MRIENSSFRDPGGFIFYSQQNVFRAIKAGYQANFQKFISSGLYENLKNEGLIVRHEELPQGEWSSLLDNKSGDVISVLKLEKIPFISYPYEWCFQQLKDAALLTLKIQQIALDHGMSLKDASAFNIQFLNGRPIFIDTLSFEIYEEGKPWVAYRQFCKHFLAPLALIAHVDPELRTLSQLHTDGVPLPLASKLLPWKTKLSPFYQLHLHYHAKLENKYSGNAELVKGKTLKLSRNKLVAIIDHLKSGISSIKLPKHTTEWSDYYSECSYSDTSISFKKDLVASWASELKPALTFDLGCNTGTFSEAVMPFSTSVISFDFDHLAIEKFYGRVRSEDITSVLPLVLDLTNPTPAIGWANTERSSVSERSKPDLVLALALIHHICIGNNVPFDNVARYFSSISKHLIIEFVPKNDPQSQRLLVTKEDVFTNYTQSEFERVFGGYYHINRKEIIKGTDRVLYQLTKNEEIIK